MGQFRGELPVRVADGQHLLAWCDQAWVEDQQDADIETARWLQLVANHLAEEGGTLANLDTDSDQYALSPFLRRKHKA